MWSWGMCVYEPCNKKRKLTIIITQGGRRWWIKLAPTISVKVGAWAAAASTSRLSESMACTCVQSLLVGAAFLVKPGQPWVLFQLFAFFSSRHIFFRTLFGRKDNSKTIFVFNMHYAWAGHLLLETQIEDDTYLLSESVKCGLHMCICICICIWTIFVFGLYTYLFSESVKCGLHRRWSVGWEEQMVEVMISSAPLLCRLVVLWFGSLAHFGGCSISSGKVWCSVVLYDMV